MPEISRFLGIIIAMFYRDNAPPHFHAIYGEYEITVFLKMTPEERLKSNDNAVRTILELRKAYQQQRSKNYRPERNN